MFHPFQEKLVQSEKKNTDAITISFFVLIAVWKQNTYIKTYISSSMKEQKI